MQRSLETEKETKRELRLDNSQARAGLPDRGVVGKEVIEYKEDKKIDTNDEINR